MSPSSGGKGEERPTRMVIETLFLTVHHSRLSLPFCHLKMETDLFPETLRDLLPKITNYAQNISYFHLIQYE
jgi:hypothetical protein